mgnify:CR=1 FL=1
MGKREDLDALLCSTLGGENVYFQPPENLKMRYPCIVYSVAGNFQRHANNNVYHRRREYSMLYITYDPDDEMIDKLADLPSCRMSSAYTADNLHHYSYTIYF